jgi:hypothetical protein
MMKEKRLTIWFLIVAVVLIWGTIIYKVISRNPDTIANSGTQILRSEKSVKGKFVYTLLLNYPDPFFRNNVSPPKKGDGVIQRKVIPVSWPNLRYNGRIASKEDVRIHITCGESSLIVKTGEIFTDNCMVKMICPDSILIAKGNEKKWYKK